MEILLVLLGAAVNACGVASYIAAVVGGRASPNRITWLLWGVIPTFAIATGLSRGETWSLVPVGAAMAGPLAVFCASFVRGSGAWRIGRFDVVCGALAVSGVAAWLATGNAEAALLLSIAANFSAGLPTLVKSWRRPQTENATAYWCGAFSAATSIAGAASWSVASVGFPLYLLATCLLLGAVVTARTKTGDGNPEINGILTDAGA